MLHRDAREPSRARTPWRASRRHYVRRRDPGVRRHYAVVIAEPEGKTVGTLDEDFAVESLTGDVFLLGTNHGASGTSSPGGFAWKMRTALAPSIPFWLGEAPGGRSSFRATSPRAARIIAVLRTSPAGVSESANADSTKAAPTRRSDYIRAGTHRSGRMPTLTTVVAERFFDEAGGMQLVISCSVRRAHQSRLGPRAAQTILPHVQFRTAGRRHR